MTEVTQILTAIEQGDSSAAEKLLLLVYEQLRRAARIQMAGERADHTLQATALVHEAYLRLVGNRRLSWQNSGHFYAAAAEAMRRILLDPAEARRSAFMLRGTCLAVIVGLCLIDMAVARGGGRPVPPLPSTVSSEAQAILGTAPPKVDVPMNLAQWRALQIAEEERTAAYSKEIRDKLAAAVDIRTMGGVKVHVVTPKSFRDENADKALIHVHGGGYCFHSPESTYPECIPLAYVTGLRLYSIDISTCSTTPLSSGPGLVPRTWSM